MKAYNELRSAISSPITENRDLAGIIKSFEFTYELAWNALKEYLAHQGVTSTTPRDVFSKAFMNDLISNEQAWLDLMQDRNLTSHTYDFNFAREMIQRIQAQYLPEFEKVSELLRQKSS